LALALDDACSQIHRAWRAGRAPTTIALGSELFGVVQRARQREVADGAPLLLLDLRLIEDAHLVGDEVTIS
jgi:hypothetical protein